MQFIKNHDKELDLSDIPSELVRLAILETIEEQLKSKKFQIHLSSAIKVGDHNFTGIIYRVAFNEKVEAQNEDSKASSLILKVAPDNLARRNQFNARPAFLREIYTFDKIFPTLRDFERSKGVPIELDGFIEYPFCYRTIDIELDECLLLEDLCIRGFSTIDRRTSSVTADHVFLVMQGLAKFHAISFAMKDQQPDKFTELTSKLSEVFISRSNNPLRFCLNLQAKMVFNAVSAEEDKHLLDRLEEFYKKEAVDTAADCLDIELTGPASVITYGDVHQNNIMFKYNSKGKPIEASFVDWQAVRHSSPMIDFAFFIFCCTKKELRDIHYDNFLKVYHENLTAYIRKLGSDPEKLFPFDLMLKHLQKCAKYGFIMSTVLLPVLTSESDYGLDFDEIAESVESGKPISNILITDSTFKELNQRLRDIVDDMVRLNYI